MGSIGIPIKESYLPPPLLPPGTALGVRNLDCLEFLILDSDASVLMALLLIQGLGTQHINGFCGLWRFGRCHISKFQKEYLNPELLRKRGRV